ncbi:MAG: hypothetical protein AB7R89_23990 [Dehalococcoidia bacterium]
MALISPLPPSPPEPPALRERAEDNLRFIRETMERAATFTAVSGWAEIGIGVLALGASVLATRQTSVESWLTVWIGTAAISLAVSAWAISRKARAAGLRILAAPVRLRAVSFAVPVAAAALLTLVLYRADAPEVIPGMWLLLYGTALITGGMLSVRVLPVMGLCFMATGAAALVTPASWDTWWMASGFGGLHILFGAVIVRRHGG